MTSAGKTDESVQTLEKTQPQLPVCCRQCGQVLAPKGRRAVVGEHTFRNPAGYSFHVVVLSEAKGLKLEGPAVAAASWFDGFAWRIALCEQCSTHLGWSFESAKEPGFVGLIATRLSGL